MTRHFDNTILYFIGYPGTGKYTIARTLCAAHPEFRLVDNHLINNPLFSLIHTDGVTPLPERIWDNVSQIWDAVLDTMIHISPPEYSFVLTNFLSDSEDNYAWLEEVENAARQRNALFVPVILTIDLEEHKKRIGTPERSERMKETDPDGPERYAKAGNLIKIDHPALLTLDVTSLPPAESIRVILGHISRLPSPKNQIQENKDAS